MRGVTLTAALAGAALAACSSLTRVELINRSGQELVAEVTKDARDEQLLLRIADRQSQTFMARQIRDNRLRVSTGRCRYVYNLAEPELDKFRRNAGSLPVQLAIGPNFDLGLAVGEVTVSGHGFPRRPASTTCAPL